MGHIRCKADHVKTAAGTVTAALPHVGPLHPAETAAREEQGAASSSIVWEELAGTLETAVVRAASPTQQVTYGRTGRDERCQVAGCMLCLKIVNTPK